MNRQQRRKMVKKGVTAEDLKMVQDITKEQTKRHSIHFATEAFAVATAITLRDKFGFGEVRLKRATNHIANTFEAITEGYVSLDDLKKVLLEECNFEFE